MPLQQNKYRGENMKLTDEMSFAIANVRLEGFIVSEFSRGVMLDYETQKITGDEAALAIKSHYGHPNIPADKFKVFEGDITSLRTLELQYHPI